MKKRIVVIGLLLSVLVVSTPAQVQWQFADGPYYVNFDDFTIGLQGEQVVLYAADSVEVESASGALVLKSTDRGQTWQKLYLPDPGVVRCVATVRDNPNIVYAAILGAGVYKSTNGGVSDWVRLPNQPRNLFVRRIAIDPTNSNVVWVGCEMTASLPVLYRSVDGGGSWEAFEPNPHRFPVTLSVSDIAIASGSIIYVATWFDEMPGGSEQGNEGVWRTINGGRVWTREIAGMQDIPDVDALAIDPTNPDVLYAGRRGEPKIFKTVDGTTHCQWTLVHFVQNGDHTITDIRVSPHNTDVVYATNGNGLSTRGGVLRTTNGGTQWTLLRTGIQPNRLNAVEVDPLDANVIYAGGIGAGFRSQDRGDTWVQMRADVFHAALSRVAKSGDLIFATSAPPTERVYRRAVADWQLLVPFPEIRRQYDVAIDPNNEQIAIIAGYEGVGVPWLFAPRVIRTTDGGNSWLEIGLPGNGIANSVVFSREQSGRVYVGGFDLLSEIGTQSMVWRSTNAGINWSLGEPFRGILRAIAVNNNTVYGGGWKPSDGARVWKSTDEGQNWSDVSNGLPTASLTQVTSVSVNPSNPDIVFAATNVGIYRTTNGGSSWSLVALENSSIQYVHVHPLNSSVVYVSWNDGSNHAQVERSTDGGVTWAAYGTGLPDRPIRGLTIDAMNANSISAATDVGVYSIPHIWTGELAANATWRSGQTYLVEGKLNVPEGVTLTIEPGAVVQFDAGASLAVYGSLRAVGTANQPIRFELMGTARTPWYGIVLHKPTESTLSYCAISHAQYGVVASTLRVIQYPTITNCTITKCAVGIYLWGPLSHEQNYGIRSNRIEECDFGIVTNSNKYGSEPVLEDNVVRTSGKAGGWFARSSPVLLRNRFEHSRQEGILCTDGGNAQFGRNMRESEPGRNIVANNASVQLFAQYASPFLGLVDDEISCNLIAGGLNRVYHNSDAVGRVHATGSGTVVQADRNFWGYPVLDQWFIADHDAKIIRRCPLRDEETEEIRMLLAAAALRADGLYEQAIALYDRVVSDYPYTPEAAGALAACAETYKEYVAASGDTTLAAEQIAYLAEVASEHPADEVKELAKLYLARAYEDKDNPAEALALYEELLQEISEPDLKAIVYRSIVGLYAAQGDLEQARATLDEMSTHVAGNRHVEITRFDLALFTGETFAEVPMGKGAAGDATAGGHAPTRYSLEQNFPNPFNPTTEIWFKLGADGFITLKLYDVLGREVKTLAEGNYEAGYHSVTLNASDLASGVYFYRLQADNFVSTKKLLLMK